jgi:hypothetical protein
MSGGNPLYGAMIETNGSIGSRYGIARSRTSNLCIYTAKEVSNSTISLGAINSNAEITNYLTIDNVGNVSITSNLSVTGAINSRYLPQIERIGTSNLKTSVLSDTTFVGTFKSCNVETSGDVSTLGNIIMNGKTVVDKFFNIDTVLCNVPLNYPPAGLSAPTTVLSGFKYGNGTYVASSSDELIMDNYTLAAYRAFNTDRESPDVWQTNSGGNGPYDQFGNDGAYLNSGFWIKTTLVSGVSVAGEWLQIKLPESIVLTSYSIYCGHFMELIAPTDFTLAGSTDNITWVNLNNQVNATYQNNVANTYQVNNVSAFKFFRLIVTKVRNSPAVAIGQFIVTGRLQSTLNTNLVTATSVGINNLSPAYPLDVHGAINTTNSILVRDLTVIDSNRNMSNISKILCDSVESSNVIIKGTLTVNGIQINANGNIWRKIYVIMLNLIKILQ